MYVSRVSKGTCKTIFILASSLSLSRTPAKKTGKKQALVSAGSQQVERKRLAARTLPLTAKLLHSTCNSVGTCETVNKQTRFRLPACLDIYILVIFINIHSIYDAYMMPACSWWNITSVGTGISNLAPDESQIRPLVLQSLYCMRLAAQGVEIHPRPLWCG